MVISTTKCGQHDHPEFVLEADESHVPDTYLKNIAETVEEMVAKGSAFRPGQTFQIGWMPTLVQSYDASRLTLAEPDMKTFRIKWAPGLTRTLRQMMLQLSMLDSVSLRNEMDIPSVRHSLIVCSRFSQSNFFMERFKSTGGNDTGWFIGCLDTDHGHNDPANVRCISVYEAYLHQRAIQGFVSFPVGSAIAMDPNEGLRIIKDGKPLDIVAGSLLDEWFRKNGRDHLPFDLR